MPNDLIAPNDEDLACPGCGYSLRGIGSDRCPECGIAIDLSAVGVSQIPWASRASIGRVRAYWKTVFIVAFRPGRIASEIARPVSQADARLFRRITVLLAYAPVVAGVIWCINQFSQVLVPYGRHLREHLSGWVLQWALVVLILICVGLWLYWATGAAWLFFLSRTLSNERQNRAIILSEYACGPLAFLWAPAVILLAMIFLERSLDQIRGGPIVACAAAFLICAIPAVQILTWWNASLVLLRKTTHCSVVRTACLGVYLPIAWIAIGCVAAVIPTISAFISLFILSFR